MTKAGSPSYSISREVVAAGNVVPSMPTQVLLQAIDDTVRLHCREKSLARSVIDIELLGRGLVQTDTAEPEQGSKRLIGEHQPAVALADDDERHGVSLGDATEPLLARPQGGLGTLEVVHVEVAHDRRLAALVLDAAGGEHGGEQLARRLAHHQLAAVDPPAAAELDENRLAVSRITVEGAAVVHGHRTGLDAEGIEEGAVGEQQFAVREAHDHHRRRVHLGDGAETLGAGLDLRLGQLGPGDVEVEAADLGDRAVFVANWKTDDHAPGIVASIGQILLRDQRPAGLDHLAIVPSDSRGLLRAGTRPRRSGRSCVSTGRPNSLPISGLAMR